MEHIIVFFYILLFFSGGFGVFAMYLLHNRYRTQLSRDLLVVNVLFSVVLFFNFMTVFLISVFPASKSVMRYIYPVSFLLGSAMYAWVGLTLSRLHGSRKRILIASAIVVVGIMCFRLVLGLCATESLRRWFNLPTTAVISLYLFLIGWEMRRLSSDIRESSLSLLCRNLGLFTVVFSIVSTAFYVFRAQYPVLASLPISLDYLFFFVWNILSFSAYLHFQRKPAIGAWQGSIDPALAVKYGITPREQEVAIGIAQGKSNKEIADAMCVSFTTVRTHVYNIFQKTGAKSRMDLLRIILEETP
ncbi:MAG: hypothetical protein JXB03_02065 [Spirochaetales bacterium]|nr:hypothetical protein [Spirochaetales bacterium]